MGVEILVCEVVDKVVVVEVFAVRIAVVLVRLASKVRLRHPEAVPMDEGLSTLCVSQPQEAGGSHHSE